MGGEQGPYQVGKATTLWIDTTKSTSYPALSQRVQADVAVIGGGIAGLTAAQMLCQGGKKVVVLEALRILQGVTGHTTAKISSNHGVIYTHLRKNFGDDAARIYGEANETALKHMLTYIESRGIDADVQRMPAYTYAVSEENNQVVREEAQAAAASGLPASYTEDVPLPLKTMGAVVFTDQAIYHPRKYLLAVADEIIDHGGQIFEETRAIKVMEDEPYCRIVTDGGIVEATDVIVATNYPTYDPEFLYVGLRTKMSYVLAVKLAHPFPEGMFYSTETPFHSLRPHWWGTERELVLVGGQMHPTGHADSTMQQYRLLEEWTKQHFPVQSIDYHWTVHDSLPVDNVPIIGRMQSRTSHVYVATGFKGWGMTHGTVAGMMLANEMLGRDNPWSSLYSPDRVTRTAEEFKKQVADMQNGEGRVIEIGHSKIAVARDTEGKVHAISSACTHRGCSVHWNAAEMTWDCHCHGSRYTMDGHIIHGPATLGLEPYLES